MKRLLIIIILTLFILSFVANGVSYAARWEKAMPGLYFDRETLELSSGSPEGPLAGHDIRLVWTRGPIYEDYPAIRYEVDCTSNSYREVMREPNYMDDDFFPLEWHQVTPDNRSMEDFVDAVCR